MGWGIFEKIISAVAGAIVAFILTEGKIHSKDNRSCPFYTDD
jgi:hypothetical protein